MAALYEISNGMKMLLEALEDGDLELEDIADTVESLELEMADKVEQCCFVLRNMEAEMKACEEEEKRFKERKQVLANKIERFKGYILTSMQAAEMSKIDAGRFKVSRRNAGGKAPVKVLCDPRELPEEFLTVTTTYTPNKDAMLQFLESGNQSEQFFLGERSQYIMIK
jgi:hypothetical protein